MTKDKIINILKKAVYYIVIAVLITLLFASTILTVGVAIKAVDIAYHNGGDFADLVDRLADTLNDNNYSKSTKGIVANAQVEINGETFVDVPIDTYNLVYNSAFVFSDCLDTQLYFINIYPFIPNNETLYFITFSYSLDDYDLMFYSYFYPTNSFADVYSTKDSVFCDCIGGSSFVPVPGSELDWQSYPYVVIFSQPDGSFNLILNDDIGSFPKDDTSFSINIYEVPTNTNETTTTESLTDILGNSINFSTSAITTSVKEVFEGLFVNENNTISNYATYVVWFSGIAIALGFFKYILRFILTMGDKK